MWLFTKYGFFSVVAARKPDGKRLTSQLDPHQLMVRARVRQHLANLQERFAGLRDLTVAEEDGTDYRFRLIVPKPIWSTVNRELAEEIDYGNFKGVCERSSLVDKPYTHALHEVWDVHRKLQNSPSH
jgi:hypothetical protein